MIASSRKDTEEMEDKVSPIKNGRIPELNSTLTANGATGLGTTFISTQSKDNLNSSFAFNPSISASALRHSSHKYSFPRSKRNLFQTDSVASLKPIANASRASCDALYDLPSTLNKEAALFGRLTEARDKKLSDQFKPGRDAPSPDLYNVTRLFDKVGSESNRNSITP